MKKLLFTAFAFVSLAISLTSCTKDPLKFSYNMPEKEACLDANPFQAYDTTTFDLNKADVLAVLNGADVSKISAADFKAGLKLYTSVAGTNLDDIESAQVYIKIKGTPGDGTQVAYSDVIAAGATEVNMSINGASVKDLTTNDMTVTLKILNKPAGNAPVCLKLGSGVIEVTVTQ